MSPNIEFLNPSNFAAVEGLGVLVSDKIPTRPDLGDSTYRLSAWVANPPTDALVEFELLRNGISIQTIDGAFQVGSDSWEADWDIPPMLADGSYTLRATVASGNIGVDSTDQAITINRLAERAEIDYPNTRNVAGFPGDARFGTFRPLAHSTDGERPNPMGNVDGKTTGEAEGTGTSLVRAFYTMSSPGAVPEWIACGTERAPGDALLSGAANDGVRCTLASSGDQEFVSAVALLANTSNRGNFDPKFNGAGDAVRVVDAYSQIPTEFSFVEGGVGQVDAGLDDSYSCHTVVSQLKDQVGREIVGANVDVHASGPTDQLKFDTGILPISGVQAPEQSDHAMERGYDCFDDDSEAVPGNQAEHQIVGGPDLKHVEADDLGTEDTGMWGFSVRIPGSEVTDNRFTTYYAAWVDEGDPGSATNDDGFGGELCTAGAVGWGAFPTDAGPGLSLLPCQPPPLCPTDPSDTEGVPGTQPDDCGGPGEVRQDLSVRVRDAKGRHKIFLGRLTSSDEQCVSGRAIVLKSRRKGGTFARRSLTETGSDGTWRIRRKVRGARQWRAVARPSGSCGVVRSRVAST